VLPIEVLGGDARRATVDVAALDFGRRLKAEGADNLQGRVHRRGVEIGDALALTRDVESRRQGGVLRRDAGRASVRVALERLDAAEREHEGSRRVGHVRPERERLDERKARMHLARGNQLDAVAQPGASEQRVDDGEALSEWEAYRVLEFEWRRARAPLGAVDCDEVGRGARLKHGVAESCKLMGLADAELEADGLAARELAQDRDETHQLPGRLEGRVVRR